MEEFTYKIKDEAGIHARPAGMLVKLSKESGCKVTIEKDDKKGDGAKLFSIMSLGIKKGDTVKITAEGERETETRDRIFKFFEENL